MSEQDSPKALDLIELLTELVDDPLRNVPDYVIRDAITELKRLHVINQDLHGAWADQSLTILSMQKTQAVLIYALEDLMKGGEAMGWSMTKQKAALAKARGE